MKQAKLAEVICWFIAETALVLSTCVSRKFSQEDRSSRVLDGVEQCPYDPEVFDFLGEILARFYVFVLAPHVHSQWQYALQTVGEDVYGARCEVLAEGYALDNRRKFRGVIWSFSWNGALLFGLSWWSGEQVVNKETEAASAFLVSSVGEETAVVRWSVVSVCIREKCVGRDWEQSILFVTVEALVYAEFIELFVKLKVLRKKMVL